MQGWAVHISGRSTTWAVRPRGCNTDPGPPDVLLSPIYEWLAARLRPRGIAAGALALVAVLLTGLVSPASPLAAQTGGRLLSATVTGTIAGRVVDAADGKPLGGARVALEPREIRRVTSPASQPLGSIIRETLTDSTGAYRFGSVAGGKYWLHVDRPGYARRSVEVELVGGGSGRVTVGLRLEPIQLGDLPVRHAPAQPFPRTGSPAAERVGARIAAVEARRAEYLGSDVRSLTAGDVSEAITLGESDLFRALQRIPGVGRRDDYTAVLWTRGADWAQTRVYFDGLPLFNPTHAGSLFSSISPNGIGEVTYQPGVRPARSGPGAAGVLELQSLQGARDRSFSGSADLSLVSAQLRADGTLAGRASYMVAARRTYVDLLSDAWHSFNPGSDLRVPYDFADITGRVDLDLGPVKVEASGLREMDRLRGDIPGLLVNNDGHWGNRMGRVTVRLPLPWFELSATRGAARFATVVDEKWRATPAVGLADDAVTLPALENGIDHDLVSVELASGIAWSPRFRWVLGYETVKDRVRYDGPFSLIGQGIPGLVSDPLGRVPFQLTASLDHQAGWSELRFEPVDGVQIETGVRVETGDSVRNGGKRLVLPRVQGRWQATPSLSLSAGWGEASQYIQAIGATAGPLGPELHLSNLWVLAGRGYPAIRAEMATAGAELWLSPAWLLSANVYHRTMTGMTEPDPTAGELRADRSHVEAESTARGVELSARRLAGRWTGSLGYALARANIRADSIRYPANADIRHSVDAAASYRLGGGWRIGGAISYASGVPFTRVVIDSIPRVEQANSSRTPPYRSFDAMVEYRRDMGGWNLSAYLHLLNLLGMANRITYAGTVDRCQQPGNAAPDACAAGEVLEDRFKAGLPRLPLVGVHIGF